MLGALTVSPNIFIKLKNMEESNTVHEMKGNFLRQTTILLKMQLLLPMMLMKYGKVETF